MDQETKDYINSLLINNNTNKESIIELINNNKPLINTVLSVAALIIWMKK